MRASVTRVGGKSLIELASRVPGARIVGDHSTRVHDVFHDSRRVVPGSLFAVRKGEKYDGRAFVTDAANKGAVALLAEEHVESPLPVIFVPDVRVAIAHIAAALYGDPFERLVVAGITGTNGKTTTATLLGHVLAHIGRPAVLGTLGCSFDGAIVAGAHTTPESDDLARTAAELVDRGASHLVMEVSSHALSLARVEAVRFVAAGFTNLSHDHLDFHRTLEAYGAAKARLFVDLAPEASVINVDDAFGRELSLRAKGDVIRVSASGRDAELRVRSSSMTPDGWVAEVGGTRGDVTLRSPLVGAHNLENLMVALGMAVALGVEPNAAAEALRHAPPVPGRLEKTSGEGDDVLVLVDYAHTPDALSRALTAVRPLTKGRVHCVFGCGGDRDAAKRPRMGEAAARGADVVVVTNDNPRSEAPEAIAEAILQGVRATGRDADVILDRALAIRTAIAAASAGDVVLIAGKGHEPYQIIGNVTRAFDDRAESRAALAERRAAWRR